MNFSNIAKKGLIAGIFGLLPFTAQAGLMVTIDDLATVGTDFSISDNGAGDLLATSGDVLAIGGTGNGVFSVSAMSNAPSGWFLNDTTVDFTLNAGASFEIIISDDGYALGSGTTHSFITESNSSNIFGTGILVELVTSVDGTVVFDDTISDNSAYSAVELVTLFSDPFTVEHVYTITNTSLANQSFTIDTTTSVPEPTSLALFSLALMGMALIRRKFYAAQ